MNKEKIILLTNDDGYGASGIAALKNKLSFLGRVIIVAPQLEQSASSHSLTLHTPLRINKLGDDLWSVNGTPADCVLVAMNKLLPYPPVLVASGINSGANLGDDVIYSGTVAAAREGSMYGVSSIAFSLKMSSRMNFEHASDIAFQISSLCIENPLPKGMFLNVNFPAGISKGIKVTRLSRKFARSSVYENNDPRGKKYYWIGEDESHWDDSDDTDFWSIIHGYISVTPLHRDQTSYDIIEEMRKIYESL